MLWEDKTSNLIIRLYELLLIQCNILKKIIRIWNNPNEFTPERFLNEGSNPSPFKFIAFQAGPRTCLGKNMAMLEMKYVISKLLLEFKFEIAQDPSTVTYKSTITHPILNGLFVKTTEISV